MMTTTIVWRKAVVSALLLAFGIVDIAFSQSFSPEQLWSSRTKTKQVVCILKPINTAEWSPFLKKAKTATTCTSWIDPGNDPVLPRLSR